MTIPGGVLKLMAEKTAEKLLLSGAVRGDRQDIEKIALRALKEEMEVEKNLIEEADKLIRAHMGAVRGEGADVGALREKILAKLARERGAVLK